MNKTLTDELIGLLRNYYRDEVAELAQNNPSGSLYIDYDDLYQCNRQAAEDLLEEPHTITEYLNEALWNYDLPADVPLDDATVRVYNLPDEHTYDPESVSRKGNVGRYLDVTAQVKKRSKIKPRLVEAVFECKRCESLSPMMQTGEQLELPQECHGCERSGPFDLDAQKSTWINHQHLRLQQPPENTKGGNGEYIDVHARNDLTGKVETGDRVTFTGVLDIEPPGRDQPLSFDTQLDGKAVVREESDYDEVDVDEHLGRIREIAAGEHGDPYELLVESVNPKHFGAETIKLAIGLQLFGGWAHHYPDGSRDRGDWHVLLLGDPGSGKSTFLRWVTEVAPRSSYASGKGATAAGLTAAAVSDDFGDTEWGLEAGALVLADGGVACVDEIDKVQQDAVSSMHDALEGQKVHVNKAGINAKLNTRTALLAAGNPADGRFDQYQPTAEQIDMAPTLMSRFDLMFMVEDKPDPEKDSNVVHHQVKSRQAAAQYTLGEELSDEHRETVEPAIDAEVLRAYIAYAKENVYPVVRDEEVVKRIEEFIVGFRAESADNEDVPVPITFRKTEALQRVAEASARIRLSDTVEVEDVERAKKLVSASLSDVGYDPETGQFDADLTETGTSRSTRRRQEAILDIIRELESPTRKDVIAEAKSEGIDGNKVDNVIDTLNDDHEIVITSQGIDVL